MEQRCLYHHRHLHRSPLWHLRCLRLLLLPPLVIRQQHRPNTSAKLRLLSHSSSNNSKYLCLNRLSLLVSTRVCIRVRVLLSYLQQVHQPPRQLISFSSLRLVTSSPPLDPLKITAYHLLQFRLLGTSHPCSQQCKESVPTLVLTRPRDPRCSLQSDRY